MRRMSGGIGIEEAAREAVVLFNLKAIKRV
jgi:hypothetical protein